MVCTDSHYLVYAKKLLCPTAMGTAVEEVERYKFLTFAHAQLTYKLQPNLWPKVTVEGSQ